MIANAACAQSTNSKQAIKESGAAGFHASKSVGHSIVTSGKVVSAASAVPLAIVGSAGSVSTQMANGSMNAATSDIPIGSPLEITDETITVGPPPDQILKTTHQ